MPFIDEILQYKSVSVVGMEKNTGKTEALNYIIRRLEGKKIAVTSIGIDGETVDSVTNTHKPEIELFEDTLFITSEKHYHERKLLSEIVDISTRHTSLGRLVTAKVIGKGKVILSGPSNITWLKEAIDALAQHDISTILVDGALSRKSFGSPTITDAMILTTGAALSPQISDIVKKTAFLHHLINIEKSQNPYLSTLLQIDKGIHTIGKESNIHDLNIPSSLLLDKYKDRLWGHGSTFFVAGVLSDNMLNTLRIQKNIHETVIIVKDFTKIYATPESYKAFIQKGGKIEVLLKTKLIAICINPTSPTGFTVDSDKLKTALEEQLLVSVYDVKR